MPSPATPTFTLTPQLVIGAAVIVAVLALALAGRIEGDAALAAIVGLAASFGLGASHQGAADAAQE